MNDAGLPATLAGTQTLERGLALLHLVVDTPMTIDQLARASGLNVSAIRRLVAGLVNQGFMAQGVDRRFSGGPALIRLGLQAQSRLDVVSIARAELDDLAERTGNSAFLGERDGDESVHLYRAPGRQRVVVSTPVGTRRRLNETSLGKALLIDSAAEWTRFDDASAPGWCDAMQAARQAGAVIHVSPAPDRFHAIAAPVRDAAGRIVAAISVVTLAQYMSDSDVPDIRAQVVASAAAISEALGYRPPERG